MTREEVFAIAEKVGLGFIRHASTKEIEKFEAFAALVASAEREACAKVCDDLYSNLLDDKDIQKHWPERIRTNKIYAAAIRARGQA